LDQGNPNNGATASNISAAIQAAALPASPGGPGVPPTFGVQLMNHSWEIPPSATIIRDGMRTAYRQGVTMVAASGNDNVYGFNLPAHVRDNWTLTVGGTGLDGEHFRLSTAYGSNNSPFVDVVAPADAGLVRSFVEQ
jgi:hypothetical protein